MNKVKKCRYGDMLYQPNDMFIGRSFELYGEFSEGETALFRQLVKPGQFVFDVGANIGAHTVPLAQLVGPRGRVIAFEPQRIPYYTLCANVMLNSLHNVICHQAAAGDAPGKIVVPDLDYNAEQNFGGLGLMNLPAFKGGQAVPIVRLDDVGIPHCHFIKIDVEGMEKKVLAGATETIRRHRPILYVEDDRQEHSAELRGFLDALGYHLFVHRPSLYNPQNYLQNPENVFGRIISLNLFCHHRETLSPINPFDYNMVMVSPGGPGVSITAPM